MNAPIRMTALALLLLVANVRLGFGQVQLSLARNEVAFYIATQGEVRPEQNPQVANAHRVFERVRAVADKNSRRLPRLVVVNSRADPWAIALPSGHVVLSKEAGAICHTGVSLPEAEARLAFVLGHELAHLAHDDFWHQEVYGFLAARSGTRGLADFMQSRQTTKEQELAADDKGFIYAAMAGYPVELLVKGRAGKPDFFSFWMQQTNARVQSVHASSADRAALLQQRLQELQNKLGFFEFGVRLSHFDYCDDAVYFFQEFQKTFPGREVLNDLGYCYLQLARQEMEPERAYFYWLPLILDGETRARSLLRAAPAGSMLKTLKQASSGKAGGFLNQALDYLKQAIDADPSYLPARLNLAVAYLYLGRPQQAAAVLAEAQELGENHATLQGLEALALYESSDAGLDLWPTAVARLEKLAAVPDPPEAVVFNLARLLSVRPRAAEARSYWSRLAAMNTLLPAAIQTIVCREQTVRPAASCLQATSKSIQTVPWKWPLPVSDFERLSPDGTENSLRGWQATAFDWFKDKLHGHIYRRPDGLAEVLELDQFVQMQVLRGERLGRVRDLGAYCAQRLKPRPLSQGVVWSCGDWAALGSGDQVQEMWWVAE
ncbi:MAG: tetratricopeptide repeat protein [Gammaproteobacteria bacterium]